MPQGENGTWGFGLQGLGLKGLGWVLGPGEWSQNRGFGFRDWGFRV